MTTPATLVNKTLRDSLVLDGDTVDAKGWRHEPMVGYVSEFLTKAGPA